MDAGKRRNEECETRDFRWRTDKNILMGHWEVAKRKSGARASERGTEG